MNTIPVLLESLVSNHGSRSITRATFPPGASAILHYHTEYRETFKVYQGELTVIKNGKKYRVKIGQSSPPIEANEIHTYQNNTEESVVVDIILEPDHSGCELSNAIFAGIAREINLVRFSRVKDIRHFGLFFMN